MATQKEFLSSIKKTLESRLGRMTWDELAAFANIEPRTLKTYRMPESSANYRQMPGVARQALEALLTQSGKGPSNVTALVPALSWLVMSQARIAVIEGQMITGLDYYRGARNGLNDEERKIMAMISRYCLVNGLPDYGGEIHVLLNQCTRPFEDWLRVPEVLAAGYGQTVLISQEYGIPTPEADELASGFSGLTTHLEERLFSKLSEALNEYPDESSARYYTLIREFIVRNPVVSTDKYFEASKTMPSSLWMAVQNDFYESIPYTQTKDGMVTLCAHCNSLMKPAGKYMTCQSVACSSVNPAKAGDVVPASVYRRVTRGIRQFWVEPGVDEIRLYDQLIARGIEAELYPHRDRVDLAVGSLGIDLKSYASPEILGARFRKSLGGLVYYDPKWIVIPDWRIAATHNYLERLSGAMGDHASRVRCLSLSTAVDELTRSHGKG